MLTQSELINRCKQRIISNLEHRSYLRDEDIDTLGNIRWLRSAPNPSRIALNELYAEGKIIPKREALGHKGVHATLERNMRIYWYLAGKDK